MGVWAWGSGKWRMEETAGARHSVPKAPARRRSHLEGWDGVSGVPNAKRALPRPHTPLLVFAHSQSALPCPGATRRRPRRTRVRSRSSPKRATEDDPAAQSATTSTRRWTASARSWPPELRTWKSRSMSASVPSRIGFRPSVTGSTPWTRRCRGSSYGWWEFRSQCLWRWSAPYSPPCSANGKPAGEW